MSVTATVWEQIRAGRAPTQGLVAQVLDGEAVVLGETGARWARTELAARVLGAGPLEPLLADPHVTDVLVNAGSGVWVDRGEGLARADCEVGDEPAVRRLAVRLAGIAGRRLDDTCPFVDGLLPGGVRLHAMLPPIAVEGSHISLRVPRQVAPTLVELAHWGTFSDGWLRVLEALVRRRCSFVVSGGTPAGVKQGTSLNACPACKDGQVAKLDPEWAISEIDKFLQVTAQVAPTNTGGMAYFGTFMRGSETDAAASAHVIEQILDRALPGWRKDRPSKDKEFTWLRDQASRAKAALQRSAELAEKLGDNAPDMDAANLHPWAWEGGKSYWNTSHYHQAVMQAAIRINAETQAKLGRMDVSEVALFNEGFSSSDPKPGAPRLRLAEDDGSKTYENLHRGARSFAEGLYTAIRNPGMHTPSGGGEEQLALEQLAAYSLLARWVDQAKVQKV